MTPGLTQKQRRPRLSGIEITLFAVAVIATVILVIYPLVMLVRYVWTGSATPFRTLISVFSDPAVLTAAWNSLLVASGTTAFATVIGVGLAVLVHRTNMPLARAISPIGILPLLTMPFVGAVAWSLLAAPRTGMLNILLRSLLRLHGESGPLNVYSVPGLIWVMGLYYSPYPFILAGSALRAVDSSLEEAARLAGASPLKVLRHTTIPLILPATLSGAFLTFSFSAGQFAVPEIIGIPARIFVLPTMIFEESQSYPHDFVRIIGIGLVLLGIAATTLVLQRLLLRRRNYEVISGKGTRNASIDLGGWKWVILIATLIYVFVMMILPLLALFYYSFLRFSSPYFHMRLLTWANYLKVFQEPMTTRSILNSLMLAVIGATLCLSLGLLIAYFTRRTMMPGRGAVGALAMLPIGVPGIVLGVAALAAWINPPFVLYGTMGILIVCYVTTSLPTATQSAGAGLMQVGRELEESARVAGATWPRMMWRILLPLLRPALLGTWLLLFITKFREMDTSVLVYSPGNEVASVALLNSWENGSYTAVAAFSVIVSVISFAAFLLMQALGGSQAVARPGQR